MSGKTENDRLYDVRVVERNIRKGLITRKDVERYLKSLPDREENAQRMAELEHTSGAAGSAVAGGGGSSSGDFDGNSSPNEGGLAEPPRESDID